MATDEPHDDEGVDPTDQPTEAGKTDAGGEEEEDSPWGTLIFGIGMMIGAVWLYWYFGKLEAEGGEVRMPAIIWAVYGMIGRTGLAVIAGLIGALATWAGISDLRKGSGSVR